MSSPRRAFLRTCSAASSGESPSGQRGRFEPPALIPECAAPQWCNRCEPEPSACRTERTSPVDDDGNIRVRSASCSFGVLVMSTMRFGRRRRAEALGVQLVELALAVPQVLAYRSASMFRPGAHSSARARNELYLMGAEKVTAFYESWNAMWMEMFALNLEASRFMLSLWWSPWSGRRHSMHRASSLAQRAALRTISSGVRPIHRRAVANARRLRRSR